MRWRTIDGEQVDPLGQHRELETLIRGLFNKETFLSYLRYFCIFEDDKDVIKKIAGYHQFHAVQAAVESVVTPHPVKAQRRVALFGIPREPVKALRWHVSQGV